MAQVNIRIDDDLKNRVDALFDELGLNMTTAFNMFVRQTLRQGGIPFEITTKTDPFYSEANMRVLRASIADMDAGRGIVRKSLEELETMENE
ncbi:MAG: type II toxin-antitoxin system RelB/DinJ family antitoxin [Peptococcaceae bacterium]|jgi:DNA-damage-inducible protein J|nr:type II toxin-antitoxin system RelB/DinJ family antitoxin [Peptococcaceae bacterium]